MPDQKLFDLHFEVGIDSTTGQFYAKTILGQNGVLYRKEDVLIPACVGMTAMDMEMDGMFPILTAHPNISSYPFGTAPSVVTRNANKKQANPNVKRQMPGALTQVPHPDCQALCTSFDNFGKVKCKNMCAQRKGI